MGLRDLNFGLGLRSESFDKGMKAARNQLRELAKTRMDELRKSMAELAKDTSALSKQKLTKLTSEYNSLTRTMKATDDQGQKTLSTFRKISDSAKGMFRGVGTGIMQGIGQGIWGTITGAFQSGVGLIKTAIDDAWKGQRVGAQLKAQLKASGYSGSYGMLDDSSNTARRAYRGIFEDEDFKAAYTALIRAKFNPADAANMTGTLADVSAGSGMSVPEVASLLALINQGQGKKALKKLGVFPDSTPDESITGNAQEQLDLVRKQYAGQASAAAENAGPYAEANSAWGEIKKSLGNIMLPIVVPVLRKLATVLEGLLKDPQFMETLKNFSKTLESGLENLAVMIKHFDTADIFKSLWDIFKEFGSLLADVLMNAANIIGRKVDEAIHGKSKEQGYLDDANRMTADQRAKEKKKALLQLNDPSTDDATREKMMHRLDAIRRADRGMTSLDGSTESVAQILDRHTQAWNAAHPITPTSIGGIMQGYADKGAFDDAATREELARNAAKPVSAGSAAVAADRAAQAKRDAQKAKEDAAIRKQMAQQAQSYNNQFYVTSIDASVNPVYGTQY